MSKQRSRRALVLLQLVLFAGVLLFLNILSNVRFSGRPLYARFDLTEERRFTLTKGSRELLDELDEIVYVNVLLEGDFPVGFKRLQDATRQILDDFRSETGYVEYEFEDPSAGSVEEANERRKELSKDKIEATVLKVKGKDGNRQQLIYPYAICYYKGRSIVVNMLENEVPGVSPEVILNNSVQLLEYKFISAFKKLKDGSRSVVAFTTGHGELDPSETYDLEKTLRQFHDTGRIHLDSLVSISQDASVIVIAKPRFPFSEKDKFKLDQYVMNGGKILWLIDKLQVDLDSLQGRKEYFPAEYDLNIDDLLFQYGVRIEPNIVLDMQCSVIPLTTGQVGSNRKPDLFPYPYHLVVTPVADHLTTKNLGPINLLFANSIKADIGTNTAMKRTPLLESTRYSRYQYLPVGLNFDFLRYDLDPTKFDKGAQTLAVLMEGTFSSMYKNRVNEEMLSGFEQIGLKFRAESVPTSMIFVSDGDITKNKVKRDPKGTFVLPAGFNDYNGIYYSNKDFMLNAIEYLLGKDGFIEARGKNVKLRLLDQNKIDEWKQTIQAVNILAPLMFFGIFAAVFLFLRKRKFAKQHN